jgi:hypothetical protein
MTTNQATREEWLELAYHRLTASYEYAEQAARYVQASLQVDRPGPTAEGVGINKAREALKAALEALGAEIVRQREE